MVDLHTAVKDRYYSVMLTDSHTYNYGYLGTVATGVAARPEVMIRRSRLEGEKPAGIDKVFSADTIQPGSIPNPADQSGGYAHNVEKIQSQYKAEPLVLLLSVSRPHSRAKDQFSACTTAGYQRQLWAFT